MSVQFATRVDDIQAERFRVLTRQLGTTPSDAIRMFVTAFNAHNGFPYDVRVEEPVVEAFKSEDDALSFSNYLAERLTDEAR